MRILVITISVLLAGAACRTGQNPTVPEPTRTGAENPAALGWKALESAPTKRTEVAAAAAGNRIFVVGGFVDGGSTVDTVEIYDVGKDSWGAGPPLSLPVNHAMAASLNDAVYIVGGYAGPGLEKPTTRGFRFEGGRWAEIDPMPEPRAAAGLAAVDGKLVIAGGIGSSGLADSTLVFDPKSSKWSKAAGVPTMREHLGVASDGNRVFVVGGRAVGVANIMNFAEAFDIASGKWSKLPAMPTARGGLAAGATTNGFIVAAGGEEQATFEEAEAFDVQEGKWISLPPLPTARHGLGVVGVGTVVYVISGGPTPGFAFSNANEAIDLASLR
jgi:non-specific serine/threonine protein kinase